MVDRHGVDQVTLLALLVSHLRGPHPIQQLDVEHHGFTDFVVFNPEATLADPALGAGLEATYATGVDTLDAGTAALSAERRFLTNFMGRYLNGCHHDDHARALRNAATAGLAHAPLAVRARSALKMRPLTSVAQQERLADGPMAGRAPTPRRRPPSRRGSLSGRRSSRSSPFVSPTRRSDHASPRDASHLWFGGFEWSLQQQF
jgi:hypothetical protein